MYVFRKQLYVKKQFENFSGTAVEFHTLETHENREFRLHFCSCCQGIINKPRDFRKKTCGERHEPF